MTTAHSFSDLLVSEKDDDPIVLLPLVEEVTMDKEAGIPSLQPIMNSIDGFRSIDWTHVRDQCRAGLNNVGITIAVISEKTHDLGVWLSKV